MARLAARVLFSVYTQFHFIETPKVNAILHSGALREELIHMGLWDKEGIINSVVSILSDTKEEIVWRLQNLLYRHFNLWTKR